MPRFQQKKIKAPNKSGQLKYLVIGCACFFTAACAQRSFPRLQDFSTQPWQKSQVDWVKMREELLKQHQKGLDIMTSNPLSFKNGRQ